MITEEEREEAWQKVIEEQDKKLFVDEHFRGTQEDARRMLLAMEEENRRKSVQSENVMAILRSPDANPEITSDIAKAHYMRKVRYPTIITVAI